MELPDRALGPKVAQSARCADSTLDPISPIWLLALAGLLALHARLDRAGPGPGSRWIRGLESKGPRPERLYTLTRNSL
jgi:hypothetical protein